jgi:PAS domain S-box-containing protein
VVTSVESAADNGAREQVVESWAWALFEGIDDAVFVHDLQGRILEANRAACRRLGYTRDELLRLTTADIDDPEFAAAFQERLGRQLSEGHFQCEGRHRSKDGRVIPVDINTSAIEMGGRPCILAVMRDITERKQQEQALRERTGLLRSVLDNMGDAVLVAAPDGRVLVCNPAAERLFGRSAAELSRLGGGPLPGMFLPDMVTRFPLEERPLERSMRGEHVDDVEAFVRPLEAHEGRWVSITGRPLRDEQGAVQGGIIVCHDITERKWAERRQAVQYQVARLLAGAAALADVSGEILAALGGSLGWDLAVLWLRDREAELLRCRDLWRRPELAGPPLEEALRAATHASGAGLPGRVWARGESVWAADLDEGWQGPEGSPLTAAELRCGFAFPIWGRGETLGVIGLFNRQAVGPDELLTLAASLGSQVGQLVERERVERELRESQAFYHSLVESLPLNMFRKDRDGRVTFGNQRYCSELKKSLPELIGKSDYDLFPEHLARKYRADDERVLETGIPLETVEEHQVPDGSRIYVQVIKTPIHDAQGQAIGTQCIFWDVTERKRAEEAVAQSERRYRQLTEATLDAIVVADQEGRILLFNPAAERLFGYEADEVVGQSLTLLMPGEYRERHEAGLRRYVRTRLSRMVGRAIEVTGRRKDGGEFPVELALSAIDLGEDGGFSRLQFLGALRDLTERNRMRAVLVQNEKLASIGLLSAGVAHEINNPLAFIGNNLAVLERDCKGLLGLVELYEGGREGLVQADPERAAQVAALAEEIDLAYIRANLGRLLERTREGIDRVTRIITSLRGLARTDKPQLQETSLPDLVEMSLEIIRGRLKRSGVQVLMEADPNPRVRCVAVQISQVLFNLLLNAVQAIESARPAGGGHIDVRIHRLDGHMAIDVTDDGGGIAPAHQPRLFDPFFTTKDVGEGTGLGLYLCRTIVNAHDGEMTLLESTPGQGTTFRVLLPLEPPRESP